MIIQCEQCRTKFRLDDSRIKDNGVKVRCAKCRHVFTVRKELPEAAQPSGFEAILDRTPAFAEATPPDVSFSQGREESFSDSQQQRGETESSLSAAQMKPVDVESLDFSAFEPPKEETAATEAPKFECALEPHDTPPAMATPPGESFSATSDEIDFGAVDFGSVTDDAFAEPGAPSPFAGTTGNQDVSAAGATSKPSALDKPFSTDEIDFGADLTAVSLQQEKPAEPKFEQDFSFTIPEEPPAAASQPQQPIVPDLPPFDLPPIPPVPPQPVIKPVPAQAESIKPVAGPSPPAVAEDELPPLSIPSRRKQSSAFKILMVVLAVIVVGALGYYGKSLYPQLKQYVVKDAGQITLRSINSSFVKNTITGSEMLVISGEAVNGFKTPRAALQVKGVVYDAKGQVLVSKNAYCGNPISAQQLVTMPQSAIDAAMANQLGSALMNLEVPPGKAIPFTVVIIAMPVGAKDFGVEPAGSQAVGDKPK